MKAIESRRCSCEDHLELQEMADRSKQIIKAIFDSTLSFIVLLSPDYRIIFFNKRALHTCKLLYGKDLQVGDSFLDFKTLIGEQNFYAFQTNFCKTVAKGVTTQSERKIRHHDVTRWIKADYTPVYDNEKIIAVALRVVDVTERRQKELQIERQNEQLRQISWIQSHKTRQPIATIQGLINILDKTTLTDDNKEIVGMLERTIDKLDAVIQDTVIKANAV